MTLSHSRTLARAALAEVRTWGRHRQGGGSWPPPYPVLVNSLARVIREADAQYPGDKQHRRPLDRWLGTSRISANPPQSPPVGETPCEGQRRLVREGVICMVAPWCEGQP